MTISAPPALNGILMLEERDEWGIRAAIAAQDLSPVARAIAELNTLCQSMGIAPVVQLVRVDPSEPEEKVGKEKTSRVSAWQAYLRGVKAGDKFKVTRVARRRYTTGRGAQFTNLTVWIRDVHPKSHTAEILRQYGQI